MCFRCNRILQIFYKKLRYEDIYFIWDDNWKCDFSETNAKNTIKVIIKELLWHATTMRKGKYENEGMVQIKYVGQRYWSKKAIEQYIENNKGTGYKNCKGLIHEHAIPRNIIQQLIKTSLNKETDKSKQVEEIQ